STPGSPARCHQPRDLEHFLHPTALRDHASIPGCSARLRPAGRGGERARPAWVHSCAVRNEICARQPRRPARELSTLIAARRTHLRVRDGNDSPLAIQQSWKWSARRCRMSRILLWRVSARDALPPSLARVKKGRKKRGILAMSNADIRGRFIWHELMTTDTDAPGAFYS